MTHPTDSSKLVRLEDVEAMVKEKINMIGPIDSNYNHGAIWGLENILSSLKSLPTQNEWIPVSERLPLYNQRVLLYMTHAVKSPKERKVIIGSYDGNFNTFYNDEGSKLHMYNVTHFMPLPNPPSN